MRRGLGVFGLVVTAILLIIVGVVAYNVGWSSGMSTHLPANTAGGPYYYGPHMWGGGFGLFPLFGLFWFLLIVFGLFWLFRVAFFGRRMWGGGWGYSGHHVPPGIEERMQEWHRRAHSGEQTPPAGTPPAPPGTPPPPDSRSV